MRNQVAIALIFMVSTGQALAKDAGFFVGLGAGNAHIVEDEITGVFLVPNQNLDDKVGADTIYAGYKLAENFALEVGYTKLDTAEKEFERRTDIIPPFPALRDEDLAIESAYLSAVLTSPTRNGFGVFGLIGYSIYDVERTFSAPTRFDHISKFTEDGVFVGIGLTYRFNEKLAARVQWTTTDAAEFRLEESRFAVEYSF
ncbi:MAG: porin family protein [Xanthomonadales bacterium]|nr:porin family protein [Xanthomonadales bacterium]